MNTTNRTVTGTVLAAVLTLAGCAVAFGQTDAEGALGECEVGMTLSSGQSCTYPATTEAFSVNARGRGSFLGRLAGIRIRIDNETIDGRVFDLLASHLGDGVWRIDRLAGSTEPAQTPPGGGGGTEPVDPPMTGMPPDDAAAPVDSFIGYELAHYGYDEHFCWALADTPYAQAEALAAAMGDTATPVYTFELHTGQRWDMCLWPADENWGDGWNYSNCDFNRATHDSSWNTLIHADEGAEYIHPDTYASGPQDETIVYTGTIADKMICVDSSSLYDPAHADLLLFEGDTRPGETGATEPGTESG